MKNDFWRIEIDTDNDKVETARLLVSSLANKPEKTPLEIETYHQALGYLSGHLKHQPRPTNEKVTA